MKKYLPFLAVLSLGFASCAGPKANYKTNYAPPSTVGVSNSISGGAAKVASARTTAVSQGERIKKSAAHVLAAAAKAKTAADRLKVIEKAVEPTPEVHTLVLQVEADVDALTQELLGVKAENDGLESANKSLILDLDDSQKNLTDAQSQVAQLKAAIQTQTTTLNETSRKLNDQIVQNAIDKNNAHKFKAIIIGSVSLMLLALMFGLFRGAAFVPPLLWVTIAAPAGLAIFLYFWLGSS